MFQDMLSQQDQLDLAATYIKHLRERIEKLKGEKEQAMKIMRPTQTNNNGIFNIDSELPLLEIKELGSGIEVMLISGVNKNFMLYEVISVLEEEGVEVVAANFSTVDDKIFYTVHAQVQSTFMLILYTISLNKVRLKLFSAPILVQFLLGYKTPQFILILIYHIFFFFHFRLKSQELALSQRGYIKSFRN